MSLTSFSRRSFLAGSVATLAGCAGGAATSSFPRLAGGPTSLTRAIAATSRVTAKGHAGFQLSSSADSTAVALHDVDGNFIKSLACGSQFTRVTEVDGTQFVMDTQLPARPQWFQLGNGVRARFKKVASTGAFGLLAVDKSNNRVLIHLEKGGKLHFTHNGGGGGIVSLPFKRWPRTNKDAVAAMSVMVDNAGTWQGDSDFKGGKGDHAPGTGWSILAGPSISNSVSRSPMNAACGGSYSFSFSGGGSGSGSGGDGGGSYSLGHHAYAVTRKVQACSFSWSTGTYSSPSGYSTDFYASYSGTYIDFSASNLTWDCYIAILGFAGALLALVGSGLLAGTACASTVITTIGGVIGCAASIILFGAAGSAAEIAAAAVVTNC